MSRYILSPHPQGTPEWFADRCGKVTGSNARAIRAKGRGGAESVTRRNYMAQIVVERLTGVSQEEHGYQSPAMKDGKASEPEARMEAEIRMGEPIEEVGFAYLPGIAAGCSVDGFVQERQGIFGAKCPQFAAQIEYLLAKRIPPEYVPQCTHELWITGAEFFDFYSYNKAFPERLQLLRVRAYRDEFDIAGHEIAVFEFLRECDALEARLREQMKAADTETQLLASVRRVARPIEERAG